MWKLFLSWELYALVVVSLVALLWTQSAYEHAPLPASLPGLVILEPVAGVLLGAAVLHVTFRTGPMWSSIEGLGAAITIAGAYVLARSPLAVGADRVEMTDERRDADHRRSAAS
jgi:FtsH-binding integral membrane protein